LKPSNILVNFEGTCKLTDFGISRTLNTKTMTKNIGTILYTAPEVWNGKYDLKADVYSYGVLLAEIFNSNSHKDPFAHVQYTEWDFIKGVENNEIKPKLPTTKNSKVDRLMLTCVSFDPKGRPEFVFINQELNSVSSD